MGEKTQMQWADFTNGILGAMGKFVMIPLVVIGSILCLFVDPLIGILMIVGVCILFMGVALILVIFKPLLIKKYPEKQQPKPAAPELPVEERRKQALQSTGAYMVDTSVPYEQLSLIQKLAVDQFGGDVELAFDHLLANMDQKTQEEYTENLPSWEAQAAFQCLNSAINQKLTPKEVREIVDTEYALAHLNMTEPQVLAAEKNPFVLKLWLSVSLLLACSVGVGVAIGLGNQLFRDSSVAQTIAVLLGCVSTFFAYKVVAELINVFRFRKVKSILENKQA